MNPSMYLPDIESVKIKRPAWSIGKAKQFVLWEEETKRAAKLPAATSYNQDDEAIRPSRFKGIGLGYDTKSFMKTIKDEPGPGTYQHSEGNDKNNSLSRIHSWNYWLNNGGVEKRPTGDELKGDLVISTSQKYGQPNSGRLQIDGDLNRAILRMRKDSREKDKNENVFSFIKLNKAAVS